MEKPETVEGNGELGGRWVSVLRASSKCSHHNRVEVAWDEPVHSARRRWPAAQTPKCDGGRGLTVKWSPAREHLVQDDPQGVDIRGGGDVGSEYLLGADVVGGADHDAGRRRATIPGRSGDAEIRDVHVAVGVDEDVRGLHVAMDDAAVVGDLERLRGLRRDPQRLAQWQRSPVAQQCLDRRAVDEAHHDEIQARGRIDTDVEDRHDPIVVERRGMLCLAPEATDEVGVLGVGRSQDLDGDVAVEKSVMGAVDHGHPAVTNSFEDLVPARQHDPGRHAGHRTPPIGVDGWR